VREVSFEMMWNKNNRKKTGKPQKQTHKKQNNDGVSVA
jgi:hypothetical protein